MAMKKEPTKKELRQAAADRMLGERFYYLQDAVGRRRVAVCLAYG